MPDGPTIAQLIWIAVAAVLLAGGTIASAKRRRPLAAGLSVAGLLAAILAQTLHALHRNDWIPLQDNFDALLWLAILLAATSLYLRRNPAMTPIDRIATPIAVLLMAGAAFYGKARPHEYTDSLWAWTHRLSAYASPLAFALAAGAGVGYLTLRSKLRNRRHAPPDAQFGSLERYERVNYLAVQIGFALLTIGLVSGLIRALAPGSKLGSHWWMSPKVLLSFGTYAVYAVVLHSPINPAFRGSKTAVLSIAGFVLLMGTLVAVQQMK